MDPGLIAAPGNDLPLFRRVFHPALGGIFFVGLLQPLGAVMPLAELQSAWICDHLAGAYHLPPAVELRADMAAERTAMFKRYMASKPTRCRSTSTTTCSPSAGSAGAGSGAQRSPGMRCLSLRRCPPDERR